MSKQSRLFPSSECEEKLQDAEGRLLCDSFRYKVRAMLFQQLEKRLIAQGWITKGIKSCAIFIR